MTKINLILICTTLFLISCANRNASKPTVDVVELRDKLQNIFDESDLPGFSLVVVNDKEVMFQNSYGFADIENKIKFTNHSVQNIASISKTFIALALMKAIEQGHLDLDEDINHYLPFKVTHPKYPDQAITIRQLSQHTSGIIDSEVYTKSYVSQPGVKNAMSQYSDQVQAYFEDFETNKFIDESAFLRNTLSTQGKWYSTTNFNDKKPGEYQQYSNIGATLAAYVIENAVNMPYEAYTQKYIFTPLGMSQTIWRAYGASVPNHTQRYLPMAQPIPDYHLVTQADGALVTSTTDFALYLIEMINGFNGKGTLLTAASYKTMFTATEFEDEKTGIFWAISDKGQPNHNGGDPGVLTMTLFDTKLNLGFFFMTNISADEDKGMIKSIRAVLKTIRAHQW